MSLSPLPVYLHLLADRKLEPGAVLLVLAGEDPALHRSKESVKPVLPPQASWLDGDWYLAPPAKAPGSQPASLALALKLAQLVVADADTRDIEDVFRQDRTLSYPLLRLANSPGMVGETQGGAHA